MKIETFKCDICGAQKGATNHWWKIDAGRSLILVPIEDDYQAAGMLHLCGEACVQRKVAEFMGSVAK